MIEFEPYEIAEAEMASTATIAYDTTFFGAAWQGEWAAGTYAIEDIVWKGIKIYESAAATNTDDPDVGVIADPPTWIDRGYVNPWRMFDTYVGTDHLAITEAVSPLEVTLSTDQIEHVGLFNVDADTLTIEILDSVNVSQWSVTYNLLDNALAIGDWYEYFYAPYPPVGRDIVLALEYMTSSDLSEKVKITLSKDSGTVSCSNCFVGYADEPGKTQWDADVKAYNTGDTSTDEWGRTSFSNGKNYKIISAVVRPPVGSENYVLRMLANLQNKPVVYDFNNDGTEYDLLRVYGAVTSISQILKGLNNSTIDVEIRGIVKKEDV